MWFVLVVVHVYSHDLCTWIALPLLLLSISPVCKKQTHVNLASPD